MLVARPNCYVVNVSLYMKYILFEPIDLPPPFPLGAAILLNRKCLFIVCLSKSITWCLKSTGTVRLIRDRGRRAGRGFGGGGKREIIYLSLHCHHQNDSCIKIGSDESHFNVSVGSDGQSHKTVSTNHNLFEEKGEPKQYRTEVLPLTSLTPYR